MLAELRHPKNYYQPACEPQLKLASDSVLRVREFESTTDFLPKERGKLNQQGVAGQTRTQTYTLWAEASQLLQWAARCPLWWLI